VRDIALTLFIVAGLLIALRVPFVGMLMWVWVALMNPHQETYGFASTFPWNLIIAIVTIGSWLLSRERKMPRGALTTTLMLTLLAWTTLNTFFAFDPPFSWHYWDLAWKTIAMCVLAGTLAVNRNRFHALVWIITISLAYYGIKGGLFTLFTGGHNRVLGPPESMLSDNNEMGDALVMTLPFLNYLRLHSGARLVRIALVIGMVLTVTAIFGTYSREAYIALAALMTAYWIQSARKITYPIVAVAVIIPLLLFMPRSFYERAESIGQYGTDASFQARLDSWWVAYRYAMDNAPFGAGFYGLNLQGVWDRYLPGEMHAAHSIYFQALGEQGIVGLVLYLLVLAIGFRNMQRVRRDARGSQELLWAENLAGAMQLSLLAFCVGGAAAPMAFFDLPFLLISLSAALLVTLEPKTGLRPFSIPRRLGSRREVLSHTGP
jgi:probable O-glycosylation ligase (exosortase A-associated)